MKLPFLLDQGVPRSTVRELQARGHEGRHVGALGMAAASDAEILDEARRTAAVVVTLDSDFHTLLAIHKSDRPSVIRIRIEGLKGPGIADLLDKVLAVARMELETGAVVSVTAATIRIRRLPLV